MSTCISKHGEFSEHEPGDWCPRCWAFNEEAIVAERDALRAKLAEATTVRTVGDLTARHIGKRARVECYDGVLVRLLAVEDGTVALDFRRPGDRHRTAGRVVTRIGDVSGTPSMIGCRVVSLLSGITTMPPRQRAEWFRDLARMLLVAADKWDAYLASDEAKP